MTDLLEIDQGSIPVVPFKNTTTSNKILKPA